MRGREREGGGVGEKEGERKKGKEKNIFIKYDI